MSSNPGASRVLVVDDSQDHADVLAELIRAEGHEVRVAYNGELAMSVIPEFQPRVVVLDVHMPRMNGHELAESLRTYFLDDVKLIGMSGYPASDPSVAAAAALVDHYFQKPVDVVGLAAAIRADSTATPRHS